MKLLFLAFALGCSPLFAHDAGLDMARAANSLLVTLSPEQKAKATFDLSAVERTNWHFIPRERKGLSLKEMTPEQRLLAHGLLSSGLSHRGYDKALSIMSLDAVLAELEKSRTGGPTRDPELYFFSIFGTPENSGVWGWRVEGHHLSLNFTSVGEKVPSMTPAFFGSNPGEVRQGPRAGTRILANEEDFARTLIKALNPEQQKAAILPIAVPKEVFNDPKRVNSTEPQGIARSAMDATQRALLVKLIQEYLGRHRPDVAAQKWAEIEAAGLDKVFFAWAGGLEPGQPHYYRVQSTSFVLEYDNTQNDANHVHSLWRDYENDFGADLLKAHVDQAH